MVSTKTRSDGDTINILPRITTRTTTMIMATKPPVEMETAFPELSPAAPASLPDSTPGAVVVPDVSPEESSGKSSLATNMAM